MAYNSDEEEMVPFSFMCPVFVFPPRAGGSQLVRLIAIEYTVHTINARPFRLSLFSARPLPLLREALRQRVQLMHLGLSHISSSFWIRTSTLSIKAVSEKRFFAVWMKFIYIADIASFVRHGGYVHRVFFCSLFTRFAASFSLFEIVLLLLCCLI